MRIAKHGEWESPVSVEMLTSGSVRLHGGRFDQGFLYWPEQRADLGGRNTVWRQAPDGSREVMTGEHYVRSMVHEYGGGSWAVRDGFLVFSTFPEHTVHVVKDGQTRPLTSDGKFRYADFQVLPSLGLVLCIREDHHESDLLPRNELVVLRLDGKNDDGGQAVASGADFYVSPRVSASGQVAWVEWDFPAMPWDATRLMVARLEQRLDGSVAFDDVTQVAGTQATAPCYPGWRGEELLYLDEPNGFWNLFAWSPERSTRCLLATEHDYTGPPWQPGSAFVVLDDGRVAVSRFEDGYLRLGLVSDDGTWTPAPTDAVVAEPTGTQGDVVSCVLAYADRPAEIALWDTASGTVTQVRTSADAPLAPEWVSVAEPVSWEGPQGTVHAWYYPPTNPEFEAPEGDLPPLVVRSHGGPTSLADPHLRLDYQYWTSRGFAILDVNYGGSAAFGRAYRERLKGQWGVVDVRDCSDGALAMVEQGRADAKKLAIEGGSAGGYTTLAALTGTDTFTAGNCLFGIADLRLIAAECHKFESQYPFGLVGGTPEEVPELYTQRSPIHRLDELSCPMLIQQGADDRVVPPNQATLMADAVRAKGLPVALLVFEDEGHGWRKAETIKTSIEAGLSFYGQVFGFTPPGVPVLPVENL